MIIRAAQNHQVQPDALTHREGDEDCDYVSPSRLARHWGVSLDTIYRDIRKGALPAHRLPGGHFRIGKRAARRYGRPIE